jgi:mannitol/fructose-specific phosphotransferase system IIA component (Ntr-type)
MHIDFRRLFKEGCILMHLSSGTKEGIIEEMIDALVKAGKVQDRQGALNAILERERKMSTGMQHGIALPHGKTDTVEGLITVFALKKEGVDFGALDGQPSRIFIMTLSSTLRTGPHIQYLSEISKVLSMPAVCQKVLDAQTPEEVIQIVTA